jgi:hypothetical protein
MAWGKRRREENLLLYLWVVFVRNYALEGSGRLVFSMQYSFLIGDHGLGIEGRVPSTQKIWYPQ